MRILMLTPYLPYPTNSGGQIRSNNLIKHLSKRHQITLCSLVKNEEDKKYANRLEPYCERIYVFKRPSRPFTIGNILRTGFSAYPFLVVRNYSAEEKRMLPEIIREGNFDLIHAETFYVCPHIPQTTIPIVLVDQTIEYRVVQHYVDHYRYAFLKPLLYIDVAKLKFWEVYYWKKAKRVVAVSEADARVMESQVRGLKVAVVRNGVGDDFVGDVPLHYNKTILFQGNYEWLQNGEAARVLVKEVLPKIQREIPDVKVIISGQNTKSVADLASDKVTLNELRVDDIAGVQKIIRTAGVMVAPLYGPGGTRLKILSSMASRLPVVTTKVGIAGIGQDDVHYLEGNDTEELAKQAARILKDKKLYARIVQNARELVESEYSYDSIADKLNQIYQEVAGV